MSRGTLGLNEHLQAYIHDVFLREPTVLRELREETAELPGAVMQIAPEQGQLMRLLLQLMDARRGLEIGVYTGYSALAMALALPEDGELIACDIDDDTSRIAQRYWQRAGVAERIDLRLAPAAETLSELRREGREGIFDFAFIDADKQQYETYYEHALALLRPGGLVMVDNVLWSGRVAVDADSDDTATKALQVFNRRLREDDRVELAMVPIADGVALARKRA